MNLLLAVIAFLLFGITIAGMEYAGFNHGPTMIIGLVSLFFSGFCVGAIFTRCALIN